MQSAMTWLNENLRDRPLDVDKCTEPWRDGGEVVTYIVGEPTLPGPAHIALILGDALFNYRAALDHLAWQLVTDAGTPKRPQDVYFPIVRARDKFDEQMRRKVPGISPAAASIMKRHQPFQNGEQWSKHPLSILDTWNNLDKHRAVRIVASNAQSVEVFLPSSYPNFVVWDRQATNEPGLLTPGMELIRVYGKRIDPNEPHGVLVRFGGKATVAYEGNPLDHTLGIIDTGVDAVLSEFERLP